jgi:hypothetical protein
MYRHVLVVDLRSKTKAPAEYWFRVSFRRVEPSAFPLLLNSPLTA